MYCFKCGKKLPARVVICPDCDTPQKRRQRYRRRMILGLFIFLAGAVAGSLFDTVFFKGQAWQHSFLGFFSGDKSTQVVPENLPAQTGRPETPASIASETASVDESQLSDSEQAPAEPAIITEVAAATQTADISEADEFVAASIAVQLPVADVVATAAIADKPAVAASESLSLPESGAAAVAVPAGKLVYKKVSLLEKSAGSDYHGFMARDGSELIFSSNRLKVNAAATYQCFAKPVASGAVARQLFDWSGNVWTPETTPDNNMVVFSSDSAKPEHIFVYDRNTRNSMPLTTGTSKNMMPSISPDGRLVAFVSNRKGSNHIWLIGIDGGNLMQITTGSTDDREPRWAPDGSAIVFTRIFEPLKRSHIMKVTLEPLGEPVAIVETSGRNWLADISPDGSLLAFTRSESADGSKNALVLREMSSGKEETLRPLAGAECFRPVWNRDSSGFVFHASARDGRSLYQAIFSRETY